MNEQEAHKLGNRHLRPISGLNSPSGASRRVRITAADSTAATLSGQHTLWMLANLLARQYGVVAKIEIVVPAVALYPQAALFGRRDTIAETIAEVIRTVGGREIQIADDVLAADVEVVVGTPPVVSQPAVHRVGIVASGWRIFAGNPELTPNVEMEGNSLACYFAACIAAGEVFKRLCGLQPGKGRFIESLIFSLWDFHSYSEWSIASDGPDVDAIDVPPFYIVGAGAVGQASAAALASLGVRGHVTVIDRETIDSTNLNRYPLATLSDVGASKTQLLKSRLSGRGLSIYSSDLGWPGYALNPGIDQRSEVQLDESNYRYKIVLSCVDKNVPRHDIQNYSPENLMGASTNGLGIAVANYDMRSDFECLKCHNPPEPKGPPVEEIAEQLRQLPPNERQQRAQDCGADWSSVERYLAEPKCGKVGEAEMEKFTAGNPDWSVGFVSIASGTLLTAQLVKFVLQGSEAFPTDKGNTLRFNFLNPGPRWSMHRRNPDCDCQGNGKAAYCRIWGQ
jgi:molybdopterin/thiamine biosynthesis adenylyltransferase